MKPLIILLLMPVAIGFLSLMVFRRMKSASFAATLASPLGVYFSVKALDPADTLSPLATLLVSPLVIALAVITVLLFFERLHVRRPHNRLPVLFALLAVGMIDWGS